VYLALIVVYFHPSRTSASVQMRDLAFELRCLGHKVLVITPDSSLKTKWQYRSWRKIKILRVKSSLIKGTKYLYRALSESLLSLKMIRGIYACNLNYHKFEGIIWYSPTIFFGLLIWFLKIKSKCKTYLILRDIFPEWAKDLRIINNPIIYYYFKTISFLQYLAADTIGIQTESNRKFLQNRFLKKKNIVVLNNWLSKKTFGNKNRNFHQQKNNKVFIYIGNIGVAQNLLRFVDLADKIQDRLDVQFLFVGCGEKKKELIQYVKMQKIQNILFKDEIPSKMVSPLLSKCFLGLISLDPRHKTHNIPGKFLAYISAGLPVLAHINAGTDLEKVIEKNQIGFASSENNCNAMVHFVRSIIDDSKTYSKMSKNAEKLFKKQYTTRKAAGEILQSLSGTFS